MFLLTFLWVSRRSYSGWATACLYHCVPLCVCVYSMSERVQLKDSCATAHAPHAPSGNGAVQFGSNVSRLKSRFLQHVSDVVEPAPCRVRPVPVVHQTSLPATSSGSEVNLLDMADHVEKFRHTRALFAQLAEQNTALRPSPPLPRTFRSASSASPPPTRPGHVDPARRSMSPSSSRSLSQTTVSLIHQGRGQSRSCNGSVTTWSQLEEKSRSVVVSSRSHLVTRSLEEGSRSAPKVLGESSRSACSLRGGTAEASEVVLRRNRPSLDLSVGAGRAVLLPKRRSREEKSLMVSKDCLEASLCQADEYWRRQQIEEISVGDSDALMSESTFSSGSGEEMARSESGHDLAAALKDTTVSPTADSAEMWSRRLSAALEAKNGEVDSCTGDCNGGSDHATTRTAENGVTSSRGRCDLENTAAQEGSRSETSSRSLGESSRSVCPLRGSAVEANEVSGVVLRRNRPSLDLSVDHVTLQNDNGATLPSAVDLSRSSVHSAGGSSAVSDMVQGNAAEYSRYITVGTDTSNNLPVTVDLSRSFDPSRSHCDLGGSVTVSVVTLQGNCDVERGSSTDCETLEGSVADCECKDVDTEKSPLLKQDSTNCCELISTSSHSNNTDATAAAADDIRSFQQQKEVDTITHTAVQQSETEDKSSCSDLTQLRGDGDACLVKQRTDRSTCGLNITDSEPVVVSCECNGSTAVCTELDKSHVYNLSTESGLSAGVFLHKTDVSDTIVLHQQGGLAAAGGRDTGSAWLTGRMVDVPRGANDVQAMSVSEDDESSGDTDYVVLGEPVSKQTAVKEAVNQCHQSNTPP